MSSLFSKVAFYPTLVYNIFLSKVSSRNWYDRIDETVLLGALPLRGITKQLVEEENVRGLVSLTEDFEMSQFVNSEEEWLKFGVKQLRLQTVDYVGTPTQENIHRGVNFILQHRDQRESVYVHCKAGRTRSATVVACYLIKANGWTPEEAVEFIKTKRSHIWLREKQLKSIDEYYSNWKNFKPMEGA
ncbi:phosphatidylglycerophosphatase and protein-tyrosine phosphatase 1-like [Argopecten irradians]|uniref:phosphatidylglycerophosphatase and protein-tyrosine phosphatase 1-like n=1 Tax=Argopecten irradians TaxID=31199 RepID=UPI003710F085